jgi:hypothetical protein
MPALLRAGALTEIVELWQPAIAQIRDLHRFELEQVDLRDERSVARGQPLLIGGIADHLAAGRRRMAVALHRGHRRPLERLGGFGHDRHLLWAGASGNRAVVVTKLSPSACSCAVHPILRQVAHKSVSAHDRQRESARGG